MRKLFLALMLGTGVVCAQIVPGRFIVELNNPPMGELSKVKGPSQAASDRRAAMVAEQSKMRTTLSQRGASVVSSTQHVMNALIVNAPGTKGTALAAIAGVKAVYPVTYKNVVLDRALPLHHVPEAWDAIGGQQKAGAGVKIGIIDTGIATAHPAFQDASLKAPAGYPIADKPENMALTSGKIIVARTYESFYPGITQKDTIEDGAGHGTAVSMCAAGETVKGPYGVITGVAPKAYLGVYKVYPLSMATGATDDAIFKAFDDALADGMDVVNFSSGSPLAPNLQNDFYSFIIDRMTKFGVMVVVSAGNGAPGLNTIGSPANAAEAISVGATENDRTLGPGVQIPGLPAISGKSPNTPDPVTGPLFDVSSLDPTGLGCSAYPDGSLKGYIAFIYRGTCTFEIKADNAAAAGAIAALVYSTNDQAVTPSLGSATLPTVLIGNTDGLTVKQQLAQNPNLTATIRFAGVVFPNDPNRLATFSSRGPNIDFNIKPDLSAVGTNVYTAAESGNPKGELYDPSGFSVFDGTSFSSPIVAGAVAMLKGARPGLTSDEYRSIIINTATPLIHVDGTVERVMQTGTGTLNLLNAVTTDIAIYPTQLSFGASDGNLSGAYEQLTLTNIGKTAETFNISAIPYDYAPAVQFSVTPDDPSPTSTLSINLAPGHIASFYIFWSTSNLPGGEYQGQVLIQGSKTGNVALIPYWQGVPSNVPNSDNVIAAPTSDKASTMEQLLLHVIDAVGIPILDPTLVKVQVTSGGGTFQNVLADDVFPNILDVNVTLGKTPGNNIFRITVGNLAPIDVQITGTR